MEALKEPKPGFPDQVDPTSKARLTKNVLTVYIASAVAFPVLFFGLFIITALSENKTLMLLTTVLLLVAGILCLPLFLHWYLGKEVAECRTMKLKRRMKGVERHATPWERALAKLADQVVLLLVPLAPGAAVGALAGFAATSFPLGMAAGSGVFVLALLGVWIWMVHQEGLKGYTPGKHVFGLRVLTVRAEACGFWRSMARALLLNVDAQAFGLVGALIMAFSRDHRRLGDMVADTYVVKAPDLGQPKPVREAKGRLKAKAGRSAHYMTVVIASVLILGVGWLATLGLGLAPAWLQINTSVSTGTVEWKGRQVSLGLQAPWRLEAVEIKERDKDGEVRATGLTTTTGSLLIAGQDGVWVVNKEGISFYDGIALHPVVAQKLAQPYGLWTSAGLLVIEQDPKEARAWVLKQTGLELATRLSRPLAADGFGNVKLRLLPHQGAWMALAQDQDGAVRFSTSLSGLEGGKITDWGLVSRGEHVDWEPGISQGRPVVVTVSKKGGFFGKGELESRVFDGKEWILKDSLELGQAMCQVRCNNRDAGQGVMAVSWWGNSNGSCDVDKEGEFKNEEKHGVFSTPAVWVFKVSSWVLVALQTLGLTWVVAFSCRKHCDLAVPAKPGYRFAGAWPRVIAKALDTLLVAGPLLAFIFINSGDSSEPLAWLGQWQLLLLCLLWALAMGLALSAWQGWNGASPGKALVGIRALNLDLKPMGFGRSLLRELVGMVDQLFYWGVGLILYAFTKRFQRLGDLAAGSVVVDWPPEGKGRR